MTKKSYLAGGIFIIILITAGIYYFLFLKKDSPQITDGGVQNGDFDLNFDGNSQRPSVSRTNGTPDPNATSSAVREVPRLRKIANGPLPERSPLITKEKQRLDILRRFLVIFGKHMRIR